MKTEKGIGHHEKHRMCFSRVINLYYTNGMGYLRISKISPVSATTVKKWCITFAVENEITMERNQMRFVSERQKHQLQPKFQTTSRICKLKS